MQPVFQATNNECFRACFATLLGIPIGLVPKTPKRARYRGQMLTYQRWLKRMGLTYIEIPLDKNGKPPWSILATPAHGILTIENKNVSMTHAVVAYLIDDEVHISFDPTPTATYGADDRYVAIGFVVKAAEAPPPAN